MLESASLSQQKGIRVLQIGGSVVVDLTRFRLSDLTGAPVCADELTALLEDILEGIPKLPPKPEQEHRHLATEDRQFEFPQ